MAKEQTIGDNSTENKSEEKEIKEVKKSKKNSFDISQDLIDTIPDEFYDGIKDFIEELSDEYLELEETYYNIYKSLCHLERKAYAEEAKKYKYPALLFAMLDERSVDKVIWKIIKPERSVRLLTK